MYYVFIDMGRSMIALFIIAFIANFAAFCTGITGCWRRSPGNITATAMLELLACKYNFYFYNITTYGILKVSTCKV